jgi:DNA-directed RNA polymerase subunit RPC12/RpoP
MALEIPEKSYVCASCGGRFLYGRPDEDALAEALRDFGKRSTDPDMVLVCDDCYAQIMRGTQRIKLRGLRAG